MVLGAMVVWSLISVVLSILALRRSNAARIALVAAWSLVLWLVNGLSFFVMFKAFDIDVPWFGELLAGIGQTKRATVHVEH